ncbi:hypothetical protein LO771_30385, partial [Streptacidiphilus sp. ASG 303]|uniref:hypothetical protein n=1 Tax=Streptacidiphilus sp. ASG 303 TaxID=2896847 RepID=UPI001E3D846F
AVAEDGGSGLPDTVEDLTDAVEQAADRLGRRRTLRAAAAVVGAAGVGATVVRIVAARRHPWRTRLPGLLHCRGTGGAGREGPDPRAHAGGGRDPRP